MNKKYRLIFIITSFILINKYTKPNKKKNKNQIIIQQKGGMSDEIACSSTLSSTIALTFFFTTWAMMPMFTAYKWGPVITRCFGLNKILGDFSNPSIQCVDNTNINDMTILERVIGTFVFICAPNIIASLCSFVPINPTYRFTIGWCNCICGIGFFLTLLWAIPNEKW